jgi:putative transposase
MKIMRAYKYKLYPTAEQEARLSAWVAAARTVYNAALNHREWYGRPKGMNPHYRDCRFRVCRQMKEIHLRELKQIEELAWISDAPADACMGALRDLEKAFQNFLSGHARYPSFRRNGLNDSFTLTVFTVGKSLRKGWRMRVVFGKDCVRLPKINRVACHILAGLKWCM